MTVSDPIADMLARIRNALMARHERVSIPASKTKIEIAKILQDEGYVDGYYVEKLDEIKQEVVIRLKYIGDLKHQRSVITALKRISKPGRRIYTSAADIPWVRSGLGIAILSTPKGVITDQQARRLHVGGEILCYIW
jgi:small subunit ribosomal protein S8